MSRPAVVDTDVLVYVHDARDRRKQRVAADLLGAGIDDGSLVLPFQAVVEFFAAVRRAPALLSEADAIRETEELLLTFPVLYPTDETIRAAVRATATYQLSWYDALIWAYADTNGIDEIISEDFSADRQYGRVRIVNPF